MTHVLITGASSGIGAALAREWARRGGVSLSLCGRDEARLAEVACNCRAAGAEVRTKCVDVTDAAALEDWIRACDAERPLDYVFANAGVATGDESDSASVRKTFAIDVGGVVNTVLPALACFRSRPEGSRGHLVLTASIAGYAPLAACPAYSAAKAFVKTWGLALRARLKREGIRVSVLCPGFVRSRITDANTCPMPFFLEADLAARLVVTRVTRNRGLIAFPWPMRLASWALSVMPWALAERLSAKLPEKSSVTTSRM